jgi:hypothetical protein
VSSTRSGGSSQGGGITPGRARYGHHHNTPRPRRVVHDDDGHVVRDEQARAPAAQVIIRAGERIARLRGLDAPRKSVSASFHIPAALIMSGAGQQSAVRREPIAAAPGPSHLRRAVRLGRR